MRTSRCLLVVFLVLLPTAGAAQLNRSAVSINGIDTNPCTVASPCRSFGAAASQTNAGGELVALSSGGYGPFTITQSITVSGAPGVHAALTSTGMDGILINATAFDDIVLRNLVLIGTGTGSYGIRAVMARSLHVERCWIHGFTQDGILSTAKSTQIDDSTLQETPGTAIEARSQLVGTSIGMRVTNSRIDDAGVGILAATLSRVVVSNTAIAGSTSGVYVAADANPADMLVDRSTMIGNGTGAYATTSGAGAATLRLSNNTITYNGTGVSASSATVYSYGNNNIDANSTDLATALTAATQQ